MNPLLFSFILLTLIYAYYSYTGPKMSDNKNLAQEELDKHNFDPDNLMVNIGGKQVPFSSINKPHHVVVDPKDHQAPVDAKDFPDLEPEAKAREAERAEKKNA